MGADDRSLFSCLARGRPEALAAGALAFALRRDPSLVAWLAGRGLAAPPDGDALVEEVGAAALRLAWADETALLLDCRLGASAGPAAAPSGPTLHVVPSRLAAPDAWPGPAVSWLAVSARVHDYAAAGLLRDADAASGALGTLDQAAARHDLVGSARAFLTAVDAAVRERLGTGYEPADAWLEGTWEGEPYSGYYFRPPGHAPDGPRFWLGVYDGEAGAVLRLELAGKLLAEWGPPDWPLDARAVAKRVVVTAVVPAGPGAPDER